MIMQIHISHRIANAQIVAKNFKNQQQAQFFFFY